MTQAVCESISISCIFDYGPSRDIDACGRRVGLERFRCGRLCLEYDFPDSHFFGMELWN